MRSDTIKRHRKACRALPQPVPPQPLPQALPPSVPFARSSAPLIRPLNMACSPPSTSWNHLQSLSESPTAAPLLVPALPMHSALLPPSDESPWTAASALPMYPALLPPNGSPRGAPQHPQLQMPPPALHPKLAPNASPRTIHPPLPALPRPQMPPPALPLGLPANGSPHAALSLPPGRPPPARVKIDVICDRFRSFMLTYYTRWNEDTMTRRLRLLRKLLSYNNDTGTISSLSEFLMQDDTLAWFTMPDRRPRFLHSLSARVEGSSIIGLLLKYALQQGASPADRALLRDCQDRFELLVKKFQHESLAISKSRAQKRKVTFLREQDSLLDVFKTIQGSVCRNTPVKCSMRAFLSRCVAAVKSYPFLCAHASNLMAIFVQAGFETPQWGLVSADIPASRVNLPTPLECGTFMELVLAFLFCDAQATRLSVATCMDVDALRAAITSPEHVLLSCDIKAAINNDIQFAGLHLNPFMTFLLVHTAVYCRTLMAHMAGEADPKKPVTLPADQKDELKRLLASRHRLRLGNCLYSNRITPQRVMYTDAAKRLTTWTLVQERFNKAFSANYSATELRRVYNVHIATHILCLSSGDALVGSASLPAVTAALSGERYGTIVFIFLY